VLKDRKEELTQDPAYWLAIEYLARTCELYREFSDSVERLDNQLGTQPVLMWTELEKLWKTVRGNKP